MMFSKNQPFKIITCSHCDSSGYINFKKCKECKGKAMARSVRGKLLFWGEPLTKYHVALRKARLVLDRFNILGAIIFGLAFLSIFSWHVYRAGIFEEIFLLEYWLESGDAFRVFFWLAVIAFSYLFYRAVLLQRPHEPVEEKSYGQKKLKEQDLVVNNWDGVHKISHNKKKDISDSFTDEAQRILEDAYLLASNNQNPQLTPIHFFLALLNSDKITSIFVRLGLSNKVLAGKISSYLEKEKNDKPVIPLLGEDAQQILFHAYEFAYEARQEYVDVTEILLAVVGQSETIQEFLYDLKVDKQKLTNVVEWVRVRDRLRRQRRKFRRAAARRSKHGIDRAMTAVATPYLNNFSQDLTLAAKFGRLGPCLARDKELEEIFRIIEGGRQSVVLVGEHGVGKMSIIEGLAARMVEEDIPERLHDKRLVYLSTSALVAGTTTAGAQERLIHIMREVGRAGNIILFVNNLHDLVGSSDATGESLDLSETLAEYLGSGKFLTLATTTPEGYNRNILNTQVSTVFTKVDIKEMDVNQTIQVLESRVGFLEYKNNVFFTYDALENAAKLAGQYVYDQNLPESAIEVMIEAAVYVHAKSSELQLVKGEDVAKIVSDKTGILTTSITEDESEKLLRLEDEMHARVIGQDEAVSLVANALRRARAELRSQKKPIANFLFLGPTGVGKTELAKTIASVYFGNEDKMIRVDMSEYQDKTSIYRLIGEPNRQGTGFLTEAVRQNPFSLLLLDELEKADPDILNLFLQVFDDGRLTDSVGRVIDFTNTIIIATSNAGTTFVQEELNKGVSLEEIRQNMIRTELKQYYRPEFLNRFDGIVLFKSLTQDEIKQIAALMLKRVEKDLEKKGIGLKVEDTALTSLSEVGYDPEFGARPMRRAIQDYVENKLAELLISGKLKRKDVVVLGKGLEIKIETK